jgi:hypothetical protein
VEISDQQIRQIVQNDDPVKVRLYGFKDITFPNFVIMWVGGVVLALALLFAANELIAPQTKLGAQVQRRVEPWVLTTALWTPPCLLLAIAFEVIEGVIVFRAFRRKFQARWEKAREHLEHLHESS